ncbi:hypothetical protein DPMN_165573 [Dreissena polymorpha]|uniref:Uncharacterized protein n=1 Tax=Dreissena polymorpha TaxID=45954 RepID=A0A9D4EV38_DREPO|nr:hypothetical protein DPMN_165573 [Dreissena polymorpha]
MTLPGYAEAVVSGFVGRFIEYDDEINSNFLVEPAQQFQDRYALRMAATLVDVNTSPTCSVRILNPFATEVTLRQDTEIGRAERIERIVSVIITEKCAEDKGNHEAMRRVKLSQYSVKSKPFECTPVASPNVLPEHLNDLFCVPVWEEINKEIQQIENLLIKYGDTFQKTTGTSV